jgi:murein DD-endopeptidase MepM/ murein hydrolase activator NlpD
VAKQKYYYDTEKMTFEKARMDSSRILRLLSSYVLLGGVIGIGVYFYMTFLFDSPEEKALRSQNKELRAEIKKFASAIETLEGDIEGLHRMDAEVYRSILNADPLSADVWKAGTGGSVGIPEMDKEVKETKADLQKLESQVRIQKQSYADLLKAFIDHKDELTHMPSIRPVNGELISGFGMRQHPINGIMRMHEGLDFVAVTGTPIYATADGVVKFAGVKNNGYGIHVDLDHGYGFGTKYGHMSKVAVKVGQKIKRGDLLGLVGNTGLSKGPHLHYEIMRNGKKIDPIDYFYSDLDPETYVKYKKQASQKNESMD